MVGVTFSSEEKKIKEIGAERGHESRMEVEGIHSSKRSRRDEDAKGVGELVSWQNASSRIIRVSRVSGCKDRHSKVWTVKGLRDRRVRLSVFTSIQFYDLQDRLGYDRPSKAVDWLIKAAAAAIVDLPELEGPFPVPPFLELPGTSWSRQNPNKESSFSDLFTSRGNISGGAPAKPPLEPRPKKFEVTVA